ncbi:AH receptor-interacting protein [Orussus abietinus]|uniref:AH receptor-interacting protein n=1 Tax=Orussus abietinus TaxID=222816 RepID=UPI000625CAD7|nr:AH receptor-interacting protein [Orussus abietinus]XP_012272722.1 AH receptor-interacting protein [Orussus abietinus]
MAMENKDFIIKKVLHAGTKTVVFVPGTKVIFHFRSMKCNSEQTVIDDTRALGRPMELVLGKKFKLEVWEAIVQKMALNEVAHFSIDKSLLSAYPFVSKTFREIDKPRSERRSHHCCGVTLQNEGIGYDDLNDLVKNPQDLEFIIELLEVVQPNEYDKETWQMTEEERSKSIPILKEKGNLLFKEKDYTGAAEAYAKAIGIVEQLMLAEKPNDTEWLALNKMKTPLLLNFAQCKLLEKDYYAVIEHCTTVLRSEPDNIKALFRRGKAHMGAWNQTEAIADMSRVVKLDPSLGSLVNKELQAFASLVKDKDKLQKEKFSNIFV